MDRVDVVDAAEVDVVRGLGGGRLDGGEDVVVSQGGGAVGRGDGQLALGDVAVGLPVDAEGRRGPLGPVGVLVAVAADGQRAHGKLVLAGGRLQDPAVDRVAAIPHHVHGVVARMLLLVGDRRAEVLGGAVGVDA